MRFGQPSLDEDSPLDTLASGSRLSVSSTSSTGSGILDAFPLPPGIEGSQHYASSQHISDDDKAPVTSAGRPPQPQAHPHHAQQEWESEFSDDSISVSSDLTSNCTRSSQSTVLSGSQNGDHEKKSLDEHPHSDDLLSDRCISPNGSLEKDSQLARTQRRYLRYGRNYENKGPGNQRLSHHAHSASFTGFGVGDAPPSSNISINNSFYRTPAEPALTRPPLPRSHSASRSWDAGDGPAAGPGVHYPNAFLGVMVPQKLGSWQDHVEKGCEAFKMGQRNFAYQHWNIAASPPWENPIAQLLLELGKLEKWFFFTSANPRYQFPSVTLNLREINANELKSAVTSICVPVRDAINNLGSLLKRSNDVVNAVAAYELSGALGSKDALLSAAQIYYKGYRNIRKDVGRARKLYDRASTL